MSNSANFKIDTSGIVNAAGDEDMAAGDIKFWPSEVIPGGWLVRDGRALSRATYAGLFAVLGTRYGAGDGATTFNIMDDRAEYIRGADMGRGVDAGRVVGSLQSDATRLLINGMARTGLATPGEGDSEIGLMTHIPGTEMIGIQCAQWAGFEKTSLRAAMDTNYGGAMETRTRNRAYVPLIKY